MITVLLASGLAMGAAVGCKEQPVVDITHDKTIREVSPNPHLRRLPPPRPDTVSLWKAQELQSQGDLPKAGELYATLIWPTPSAVVSENVELRILDRYLQIQKKLKDPLAYQRALSSAQTLVAHRYPTLPVAIQTDRDFHAVVEYEAALASRRLGKWDLALRQVGNALQLTPSLVQFHVLQAELWKQRAIAAVNQKDNKTAIRAWHAGAAAVERGFKAAQTDHEATEQLEWYAAEFRCRLEMVKGGFYADIADRSSTRKASPGRT